MLYRTTAASSLVRVDMFRRAACSPLANYCTSAAQRTITFPPLDEIRAILHLPRARFPGDPGGNNSRFQDRTRLYHLPLCIRGPGSASLTFHAAGQPVSCRISRETASALDTVAIYTKQNGDPLRLDLTPYTSGEAILPIVRIGDAKAFMTAGAAKYFLGENVTGRLWRWAPISQELDDIAPIFVSARTHLYPKLAAPERHIFHFNPKCGELLRRLILFRTLQGLVNREKNQTHGG